MLDCRETRATGESAQSLLTRNPTNATPHGGGEVGSCSEGDHGWGGAEFATIQAAYDAMVRAGASHTPAAARGG